MKKEPTMEEKILSILTYTWLQSFKLIKVNSPKGWIGSSGDRTARRMAEEKRIMRKREGKYAYYKLRYEHGE